MESVTQFVSEVAKESKVSACKSRIILPRKMSERSKLIRKRKGQKQRIKKLAKELITTEAEIQLVESDIRHMGDSSVTAPFGHVESRHF